MLNKFKMVAIAAALAASASANAYVLDSFTTEQYIEDGLNDGVVASNTIAAAEAIGGWRDLFVSKDFGSATGGAAASIEVFGGALGYSAGANASGTGMIRYDGASFGPAVDAIGLGSVDLFATGSQFLLTVLESDGGFPFSIRLWSGVGNSTTVNLFANEATTQTDFVIPFSFFDALPAAVQASGATRDVTGTGADLAGVGAIEVFWTSIYGGSPHTIDFRIDTASVVPEPGSMALIGLGLLGAGLVRRRKAAAK